MISWKLHEAYRLCEHKKAPIALHSHIHRHFHYLWEDGVDAMTIPRSVVKLGQAKGSWTSTGKIGVSLPVAPNRSSGNDESSLEIDRSDQIALLILQTVSTRGDTMLSWEL